MEQGKITKVKLSNGDVYTFFDKGAMRVDPGTKLIFTGIDAIDTIILSNHLRITEIDDMGPEEYNSILVTDTDGRIGKRPKSTFLRDDLDAHTSVNPGGVLTITLPQVTPSGE